MRLRHAATYADIGFCRDILIAATIRFSLNILRERNMLGVFS